MLRATLLQLGALNTKDYPSQSRKGVIEVTRALYNVTAERARGFSADMVILEREPVKDDQEDQEAFIIFTECLSYSAIKTMCTAENHPNDL